MEIEKNITPTDSNFMTMETFVAFDAREIVDSMYTDELHSILVDIKNKALQGKPRLCIYTGIKDKTQQALAERGFEVFKHPHTFNPNRVRYSIYWA